MNLNIFKSFTVTVIVAGSVIARISVDATEVTAPIDTQHATDTYKMGPCRIRIAKLFGGHFKIPNAAAAPTHGRYYFPTASNGAFQAVDGFGVDCMDAPDIDSVQNLLGIAHEGDHWFRRDSDGNRVPFEEGEHVRIINLRGLNWSGLGLLVTAAPARRTQNFSFCLVHEKHAICGETPVMLMSHPHNSDLPKMKAILQSIEFVDDGPTTSLGGNTKGAKE